MIAILDKVLLKKPFCKYFIHYFFCVVSEANLVLLIKKAGFRKGLIIE